MLPVHKFLEFMSTSSYIFWQVTLNKQLKFISVQ